ncbi:MAG: GTPase ObgE [Verrucomicrobiota bacterium]|nr:GTPase ObgE [Verrucomicrobiota bacterium]
MKARKFVDVATLYAAGGAGGNGCCSFRRERGIPRGGPDGGDGGSGGSVILRADPNRNSLVHLFYAPHQRAENGGHGKGKQMCGRDGRDQVVTVPCGVVVRDAETGGVLEELVASGAEFVAARGGRSGLGNIHWKSSTNRAPREHTPGEPGEQAHLILELKLLADAGLVGFPNAGKSSLLSRLSNARPKIADYPFTTLNPIIGTMIADDCGRITVADIPGLIEGSHAGVGLGHEFLRHIERSSMLIYVLDMAGADGRNPARDFRVLEEELRRHRDDLPDRPCLLVANKVDLPEADANWAEFVEETGRKPIRVSALTGAGIAELKKQIVTLWMSLRPRMPRKRPSKRSA